MKSIAEVTRCGTCPVLDMDGSFVDPAHRMIHFREAMGTVVEATEGYTTLSNRVAALDEIVAEIDPGLDEEEARHAIADACMTAGLTEAISPLIITARSNGDSVLDYAKCFGCVLGQMIEPNEV